MEVLLLDSEAYVQERFREIEAARRATAARTTHTHTQASTCEQYEQDQHRRGRCGAEEDGLASLARDMCVDSQDDEALLAKWRTLQQRQYRARADALDAKWLASHLERKLVVLRAVLTDHYSTTSVRKKLKALMKNKKTEKADTFLLAESSERAHGGKSTSLDGAASPLPFQDLPLATQLGLRIFFRFSQSLQDPSKLAANCRVVLQVAARLPSLLAVLPPFPLPPGFTTSTTNDASSAQPLFMYDSSGNPKVLSVFQSLFVLLSDLLNLPSASSSIKSLPGASGSSATTAATTTISSSDRSIILTAYTALCLKWGSLRHLLSVILLLFNDNNGEIDSLTPLQFEQLEPLFAEVAHALPEVNLNSLQDDAEDACCGYLMSFGKGDHGKLGHGQCSHASCAEGNCTENKNSPTMISATRDTQFSRIDSLSTHSVAITTKGELLAWGNGDKYRLGHGTTTKEYTPKVIESISVKGRVVDISCGLGHTIALMECGDLYAWGNGSNGRLGLGDTTDRSTPTRIPLAASELYSNTTSKPTTGDAKPQAFRHVYCGASHSLAISYDGHAYVWGKNNQGQCGHGHTNDQLSIQQVKFFKGETDDGTEEEDVVHAAGGWEHTLFCTASGRVYSCGCGYKDSRRTGIPPVLGHGDCERRIKPTVVQFFVDNNDEIAKVACGWDHSLAVSTSGLVYSWGSGTNGKLGHDDEENCDVPTLIRAMEGKRVKIAKAGCEHTVLLTDEQQVWTFGQGDSGRLGHGDNLTRKVPTLIESFAQNGLKPVAIAVGDKYNLVLVEDCHGSSDSDSHHDNHHLHHTVSSSKLHVSSALTGSDAHRKQRRSTFLRRELEKKKHFPSGKYSTPQGQQHCFESDWVLAVGKNLQKQAMNSKEQRDPRKSDLTTGRYSSADSHDHNNLPPDQSAETNKPDSSEFFPQSRSECVLFLVGHIDRLSAAYFSEDRDKLRKIHDDSDGDVSLCSFQLDTGSCSVMLPFAIDTSRESFVLLLQILRLQVSSSSASTNDGSKSFSASDGSHILLLQRMCIALSCLRILKSNLSKMLHSSGGGSLFALSSLSKESALQLERACSSSGLEAVNALEQIHNLVNRLASADAAGIIDMFRLFSEEKQLQRQEPKAHLLQQRQNELLNIAQAVSQEAAQVLQVGFVLFNPQPAHRRGLLWELTCKGSALEVRVQSTKTLVLANRVCEADVMEELLLHMFAREDLTSEPKHVCVDDCRNETGEKDKYASDLIQLMSNLVQRCAIEAVEQLEGDNSNHLPSYAASANDNASLRVLSVLQVHLFGITTSFLKHRPANHREADQQSVDTPGICPCVVDALLLYLDVLFSESMVVLKKLHKASCQHEEVVTWRLNESFFHSLLPTTIQALCILLSPAINSSADADDFGNSPLSVNKISLELRFAHRLLPHIHPMLKLLDEVNWKMRRHIETSLSNNQTPHERCDENASSYDHKGSEDNSHKSHNWVIELQDACAILCGKLACVAVAMKSAFQGEEEEVVDDELKASIVSATLLSPLRTANGRLELAESKIAPEIAEMLQWEQNGVFEVENELERSGDADSGSSNFDKAQTDAEQLARDQSYSKDSIKSASECCLEDEKSTIAKSVGAALFRIGLCFFHDLLRKLTISSTKGFLLSELLHAMRPPANTIDHTQRSILHPGMSTPSLSSSSKKSIENLFIRLAKVIAADDSSLCLKQKALLAWAIPFEEFGMTTDAAASVIAKAGITNVIADLLVDEVGVLETSAGAFNHLLSGRLEHCSLSYQDISAQHSSLGSRPLKPITTLLSSQTPLQSLGSIAWVVLCTVALQLNMSSVGLGLRAHNPLLAPATAAAALASSSSSSLLQRPMSGNKDYASPRTAMSPRKRLTLPKRIVVSTVGDSVDQVYVLLFTMLTKAKHELELQASHAARHSRLLLLTQPTTSSISVCESSQVLLFGNPIPVSSTSSRAVNCTKHSAAAFVKKPRRETGSNESAAIPSGFTVCAWIHIEQTGVRAATSQLPKSPSNSSNTRNCSFPSEPPVIFALSGSKSEKMAGENNGSDISASSASGLLTENELVVCAYRVDSKRVALAIGLKQANGAAADQSLAGGEHADNQADARPPSWETMLLEDDIQVGQWVHVAIVYHETQNCMTVFLDGKRASLTEQPARAFATSTIFKKLASSRFGLNIGGKLSEQEGSILLAYVSEKRHSASAIGDPSSSKMSHFMGAVDDLAVLKSPLLDPDVAWIAQRGPILFQLKHQHIAESQCTDILQLLCQLMNREQLVEQPIRIKEAATTTALSARWVSLFVRLLGSFPSDGWDNHARALLCELLQKTLPKIQSEFSLLSICKSVFWSFDMKHQQTDGGCSAVSSIRDVFLEQNGLHKSNSSHYQQNDSMAMAMKQNETLQVLLHDNRVGFGGHGHDCGKETEAIGRKDSRHNAGNQPLPSNTHALCFASGVRLVQRFWESSVWREEIRVLLEKAASGFLQSNGIPDSPPQLKDNPDFWELVAVASALGGYSELSINKTKALTMKVSPPLALSVLPEMELPFSSTMKIQNASRDSDSPTQSAPLKSLISNLIRATLGSDFQLPARKPLIPQGIKQSDEIDADKDLHELDRYVLTMVHLRASVLRFVAIASQNDGESLWTQLDNFDNEQQQLAMIEQLFHLSSTPVLEFLSSALGPDHKKALKHRSIRTAIRELLQVKSKNKKKDRNTTAKPLSGNPFPSIPQLEALACDAWENCNMFELQGSRDRRTGAYWWKEKQHPSHRHHSLLEVLGGEIEIHSMAAKALEHFPTVRLGGNVAIAANSGLWFYEVVVLSDGLMQIGYIDDSDFASDPIQGQGVGDHASSWGFDGFRCKKWNVNSSDYGEPWRAEDVVGVLLDTDRMELSYFLNGKFLGVAFSGIPMTQSSRMRPAASLNVNQAAQFNFGSSSTQQQQHGFTADQVQVQGFAYMPVLDSEQDQSRLQPVALAINDISKDVKNSADLISDGDEVSGLDEDDGDQSDNNDDNGAAPSTDDEDEDNDGGSGGMETSQSSSFAIRLPHATYFSEDNTTRDSRSRENATENGGEGDETIEDALAARRNDLIDGLTGLGFPREWAIRCAIETNLSINESGAVSWILEQMEKDATAAAGTESQIEASTGHGQPITESTGAAGRGIIHVADLLNSRSADDLSLLTSTSATLSGLTLLNVQHYAGLSAGTDFRPHTEHLSRNRAELFSELQNPTLKISASSSSSSAFQNIKRRDSSATGANPYLAAEQEDAGFEDDEWPTANELFVAREYNGNGLEQLLSASTRTDTLQPNSKKSPTGAVQDRSGYSKPDGDEMVPLCLTLDGLLIVLYARHTLFNFLTSGGPGHTQLVLGLVSNWCSKPDLFRRLARFLRSTLGLEKHEPVAETQYLAGANDVMKKSEVLQRTFRALLTMEYQQFCDSRAVPSENEEQGKVSSKQLHMQQLPIFHALFNEIRDQCAHSLSSQKLERGGGTAIGSSAAWVLWLEGVVFTSAETLVHATSSHESQDGEAPEVNECMRVVASTCYSLPFFQTLVAMASRSSFVTMPWKLVAFTLMKRILDGISRSQLTEVVAESQVVSRFHSESSCWASDPLKAFESAAQMPSILDLFALRYRKENLSGVFFSSLTHTVFKLLVHHRESVGSMKQPASSHHQQSRVSQKSNSSIELDFCIEAFSSNYVTVSWSQSSTSQHREVSPTDTVDASEHGVESTVLSLSVSRQLDQFHEVLFDDEISDHAPRVLPSKGTYTIRNLLPDTRYTLRLSPMQTMVSMNSSSQIALNPPDDSQERSDASPPTAVSAELSPSSSSLIRELRFQTPPEPLFQLNAASMGKNLTLFNRNLSVKNLVNKKWHTVRASVGFDEGVHQWHVRIDTCVSKNIFIGICTLHASLENYIGSDGFGYGFLANKAVWHNKSKLHSYGEIFKQGDLLQVTLDCNAKTLAFSRNGEYLGIAATNLHTATSTSSSGLGLLAPSASESCKWYPAFSMYNKDDQLTIIPPSPATMFAKSTRSQQQQQQNASMLDLLEEMQTVNLY